MEEESSDFDYCSVRRTWITMLLVICTVALVSNRPKDVPLYAALVDERAISSIEVALRREGFNSHIRGGRLVVSEEELTQARVALFKRGLPGFRPYPGETSSRSGPNWDAQVRQAEADVDPFIRSIPGVQDFRISYRCTGCHYYWPENHTCDRVWLRILMNSSFGLTPEERLGLLSFLAHSMTGVEAVGFVVVDGNNREKPYFYDLDLRRTAGQIKMEDCELTTY